MEALAGYGSDGSSDASSGPTGGTSGGGGLGSLLPDASSSEDEQVVPEEKKKAPPAGVASGPAGSSSGGGGSEAPAAATNSGDEEGARSSPKSKRGRWDNGGGTCNNGAQESPLPPPKLSSAGSGTKGEAKASNAFEELIRFDKDYTVQLRANITATAMAQTADGGKVNSEVSQKLDALYKNFYGAAAGSETTDDESGRPTSFASHLRHQHEFGNPNLFPSVVEQFRIEAGGSNMSNQLWKASGGEFRDFESCDRLMAAEEQARFRAANSNNPSG